MTYATVAALYALLAIGWVLVKLLGPLTKAVWQHTIELHRARQR